MSKIGWSHFIERTDELVKCSNALLHANFFDIKTFKYQQMQHTGQLLDFKQYSDIFLSWYQQNILDSLSRQIIVL